jgi:hypothetical protein
VLLAALWPAGGAALPPEQPPAAPTEYHVKAAFLYHFAHLVEWPPDRRVSGSQPFEIAVVGRDVFGRVLEEVVGGKAVRGHPIRIRRYRDVESIEGGPQIVFLGAADPKDAEHMLAQLGARPSLTVGELENFARYGGMIGFRVTAEGRVTFDINLARTEQAGLRMSSQLLKLARIVGARG